MSRLLPIGAALCAGLVAWLSQATIGFRAPDGSRLAIVPMSPSDWLQPALAAAVVYGLWRLGASLLPLWLLVFLLLPWLPFPVPAAFLLWVTPLSLVMWCAVLLLMIASIPARPHVTWPSPRRTAAISAFVLFSLSAWRAAPMVPGGDEPHYLVITQSLLLDGDLTIEDVHRRGDYREYFAGELPPHVQRRGRNGEVYSVHAPGLPVLVAPAFALGGYPAVVLFLLVIASAGTALAWHVAWLATRRDDAAWFGWAAVTLPVTAIFQSFTVYPDGIGGVLALSGLWALLRTGDEAASGATRVRPWLLHGAALAALPWLHSRFAVLAGGFGALVLLRLARTKNPAAKAVAFLAVPAVSAMLWVGFFIAIYGTPDPSAPYGPGEMGSFRFVPGGLAGLLFDQRFGLLAYAPVLACGFAGLGVMLARPPWRRLALELGFVLVPYLLTVTHFAMWWGGWSPPARFFAPVLPLMAVPAAAAWMTAGRTSRLMASAALVFTALTSLAVVGVDRGRLAFNTREAPALWLEWSGRLGDLTRAAPMWARETDIPLFRIGAIWIGAAIGAWFLLRAIGRTRVLGARRAFPTVAVAVLGAGFMVAVSVAWALEGVSGRTTVASQLQLLGAVAGHPQAAALQLDPPARITAADLPARMQLEVSRRQARRPGTRDTPPLFALPQLPAGRYRLSVAGDDGRGWLMIGISRDPRDPFAVRTVPVAAGPIDLHFPVDVRGLAIRGDEDAWRAARTLTLQPVSVTRPSDRLSTDVARRAARYGDSLVYFLDDRSFPEPEAFWVGGGRDTTFVLQPDQAEPSATLRLRNAPVDNRVTVSVGGWRRALSLAPGEEQPVEIPLDGARGGALVRVESSSGFRPAERDPASRDQRFLGVWIKVGG